MSEPRLPLLSRPRRDWPGPSTVVPEPASARGAGAAHTHAGSWSVPRHGTPAIVRSFTRVALCLLLFLQLPAGVAAAAELRLASWNIANLYHQPGASIPGRDTVREARHFEALREYARALDADVVALQEVNSEAAIHAVFPHPQWVAYISGRRASDLASRRRTDGTYTGFAVRAGIRVLEARDVADISVSHRACSTSSTSRGVPMRRGIELLLEHEGQRLRLLNVHLKARCARGALLDGEGGPLAEAANCHCVTLAEQIGPLRQWIARASDDDTPFVLLGDFNRAFDRFGERDHLWAAMQSASPLRLWRLPFRAESPCWKGVRGARHYPEPIDFLVFDERAWSRVDRDSFDWLTYDPAWGAEYDRISDHCPIAATLCW
jgi:endonuclease/exonuclease/phosphatase family metal-dependent hydrolase